MSLESWKAEYYPVEASEVPEVDAARHSLQKWIGLRACNLNRHGMEKRPNECHINENVTYYFLIADGSCALCKHYLYDDIEKAWTDEHRCRRCPLKEIRGVSCDKELNNEASPYASFVRANNPEPMIELLKQAISKQLKEIA